MQPKDAIADEALSEAQRQACEWNTGAFLLLAGPGSGKTTVLTRRVIRVLQQHPDESFKILALTFTNRAAEQMRGRVEAEYTDSGNRLLIGTFHSFAADVLRQAGQNLGLRPDFEIYSRDEDRVDLLDEALRTVDAEIRDGLRDVKLLPIFDRAASLLLSSESIEGRTVDKERGQLLARAYEAYHAFMIQANVQDFPALVLNAFRLFNKYPALSKRYRQTFRYWAVDEFQDTTYGQYELLKTIAAGSFSNIFAVADDDQIIFQWNGASYQRLQEYIQDFSPTVLQLPTNYRCPESIVDLANRLISNNHLRQPGKQPLVAGKKSQTTKVQDVRLLKYSTDAAEAAGIAQEIANQQRARDETVAVLARTKAALEMVQGELRTRGIKCRIAQRLSDFQTLEMRWLQAALTLASRRADAKALAAMVGLFNAMAQRSLSAQDIEAEANASGGDYLKGWMDAAERDDLGERERDLVLAVRDHLLAKDDFRAFADRVLAIFDDVAAANAGNDAGEYGEDRDAWNSLMREIRGSVGSSLTLDSFLQELELRSKEPPMRPGEIPLMTIHSAKGNEFDHVFLVGVAEEVLPSFQSLQKGEASPEMEEERRNCFVAITRTRQTLTVSYALQYRGWAKRPSRFLREMQLVA